MLTYPETKEIQGFEGVPISEVYEQVYFIVESAINSIDENIKIVSKN